MRSGIYRFCRNPAYMGFYISSIGMSFLLSSIIYFICFCIFLINQPLRILQEKKFLTEAFGDKYEKLQTESGKIFSQNS
ncbi:MAG: methyltransferase family protein [Candidatus Hodarchaeota archaeon]